MSHPQAWPEDAAALLRKLVVEDGGFAGGRAGMWLYERKLIAPVRAGFWVATAKGLRELPKRNPGKKPAKKRIRNDGHTRLPPEAKAAKVSPKELKKLKDIYTDMHWGAKPTKLIHVRDPLVPNLVAYGALTELKAGNKVFALGPGCWLGFDPKKTRRLYIILSPAEREKVRKAMKYAGKAIPLQEIAKQAGGRQVKNPMPKLNGVPIGALLHCVYDTEKLGEDTPGSNPYIHTHGKEHAKGVRPILAADASGRLHYCGGDYLCVAAGITG